MQDRYTGDAGDFGKYGLLRFLCSGNAAEHLKLAVNWYFVPSGGPLGDGKKTGYLLKPEPDYRCCDKELFDDLRGLLIDADGEVIEANRRIDLIEASEILPNGTSFYRSPLSFRTATVDERGEERRARISSALQETKDADLVFLDPDNGIACASARPTGPKKGPKYVFWDEILAYTERNQSVAVIIIFAAPENMTTRSGRC